MAEQDNTPKSASRVSLDHFDPEGVRELSRTLSQSSAQARVTSVRSDKTLAPEEPFSLEKILRTALDKYVQFTFCTLTFRRILYDGMCLTTLAGNMTLISRGENLAYTSRTFASLALAQQRLIRGQLDR